MKHQTLNLIFKLSLLNLLFTSANQLAFADNTEQSKINTPLPLLQANEPVDWWFIFKFNANQFEGCPITATEKRTCPFGGTPQNYKYGFSQQFVYASSKSPTLTDGLVCLGDTKLDPLGATFDSIYNGDYYYVVWNDQFYEQPFIEGCKTSCSAPWGHAKGVIAWDKDGNGTVIQVTTPAWPGSGNVKNPRAKGGNTLGCISLDDDIAVAQHFFSLKLNKADVEHVIKALLNASAVTDTNKPQLVRNGGPDSIRKLVSELGKQSNSNKVIHTKLSSGVELISKPSLLHVPPWQLVSAQLGGVNLRTATWWADPKIPSTEQNTPITCWRDDLGKPGSVTIATSGSWKHKEFSLEGGLGNEFNHAKFAVDDVENPSIAIFGDMNQQGAITPGSAYQNQKCSSSQNGRGGTFYVIRNKILAKNLAALIKGSTAPASKPFN